jgi:hypothetical protein
MMVRAVCLWVVVSVAGSLLAPLAAAQDLNFDVRGGPPQGGDMLPPRPDGSRPGDNAEYISDVQGRVALREELESRWSQARQRQEDYDQAIARLRAARPPQDADPAEIERLEATGTRNRRALDGYQGHLGTVYSAIDADRSFLSRTGNPQLSQALGPLIGTAGAAFIPVWKRPTLGNLGASLKNASNVWALGRTHAQIGTAPGLTAAVEARLGGRQPPAGGHWATSRNKYPP